MVIRFHNRFHKAPLKGFEEQEQWMKFQTQKYKDAWPKPDYMAEPRETVYVRDGGDGAYRQKTYAPGPSHKAIP